MKLVIYKRFIETSVIVSLICFSFSAFALDGEVHRVNNQLKSKKNDNGFIVVQGDLEKANEDLIAAEAELIKKLAAEEKKLIAEQKKAKASTSPTSKIENNLSKLTGKTAQVADKSKDADKQKELLNANSKISALNKRKASLEAELAKKDEMLRAVRRTKSSLQQRLSKAEKKVADLVSALKKARDRLIVAETEVERLANTLESRYANQLARSGVSSAESTSKARLAPATQTRPEPVASDMKIATVTVSKANLRTGPGKNHSPLMTVSRGTRLAIETRRGAWYRVLTPTAQRAWVSSSVVSFGANRSASPSGALKIKGYDPSLEDEAFRLLTNGAQ